MRSRTLLILLLSICLLAPVVANPNGPPWINPINGGLTVETGCTCHGDGVPSNDVVVSISGVPVLTLLENPMNSPSTYNMHRMITEVSCSATTDQGRLLLEKVLKLLPTPMALNQEQYHKRLQATIGLSPGLHHQRMLGMFPFHSLVTQSMV